MLGGSVVVYSQLLQSGSSASTSLTPSWAGLYMILLAVHYAVPPKLGRTYIPAKTSKVATALVEAATKSLLAATLFVASNSRDSVQRHLHQWSVTMSLHTAAIPALLYALQGVLQYQSHLHLDAVTFNGLSQNKTLAAAFFCWLLLRQTQSVLQIAALLILFASALRFQRPPTAESTATSATSSSMNARLWRGVLPCGAATLLSGPAGALSQKELQMQRQVGNSGSITTDPFLYALEVSAYSALTLALQQSIQYPPRYLRKKRTTRVLLGTGVPLLRDQPARGCPGAPRRCGDAAAKGPSRSSPSN